MFLSWFQLPEAEQTSTSEVTHQKAVVPEGFGMPWKSCVSAQCQIRECLYESFWRALFPYVYFLSSVSHFCQWFGSLHLRLCHVDSLTFKLPEPLFSSWIRREANSIKYLLECKSINRLSGSDTVWNSV